MPITFDQIIEEARHWPREQVTELLDRLNLTLNETIDPEIEQAWKEQTRRRVTEIESGRIQGIPGEEVSARIRGIVGR